MLEFKKNSQQCKTIASRRIQDRVIRIDDNSRMNVGCLLKYYLIAEDGKLRPADVSKINDIEFLPLQSYRYHSSPPTAHDGNLFVAPKVLQQLNGIINLKSDIEFLPGFGARSKKDADPDFNVEKN